MSMRDCINRAVAGGEMDKDRAARILREYDGVFEDLKQNMGHTQAEAQAARVVMDEARKAAFEKRRIMQLQSGASARLGERMLEHKTMRGDPNPHGFLKDITEARRGAGGETISGKYEAINSRFRGKMLEAVKLFRTLPGGFRRNKGALADVGREIFGEASGNDVAKSIARSWNQIAEELRTRRNSAGGNTAKRGDWNLPQSHDALKARKAGYERWREAILFREDGSPALDLDQMGAQFNDGVPFTEASLEVLLQDAYRAISTDGHSRRKPSGQHGSSMRNRRMDHRFFVFKSFDDWSRYNDTFGSGKDVFNVMLDHIDDMSLEIGMMEVMGPNPLASYALLKDQAMSMAQRTGDVDAPEKVRKAQIMGQEMFDHLQGKTSIPVSRGFAMVGSAIRNYSSAALLGRAVFSSVTDINKMRQEAAMAGLGHLAPTKMMGRIYRSPKMRDELATAGLLFRNGVEIGNAVARFEFEDMQFKSAAGLADFTVRTTGLGWLTEARKQASGGAMMHTAAVDWAGKKFADLDPKAQRFLEHYGLSRDTWNLISRADIYETPDGLKLLRPQEIEAAAGRGAADMYLEAVQQFQELSVPSTNIRGQVATTFGTKRGTVPGELVRFGRQFKGFSVTLLFDHIMHITSEAMAGRPMNALTFGAGLVIGNTLLGGVAIQMKELAKGRDPRDMTIGKFWSAAFLQGGGLGILGDFVFADHNRFGGGLAETLAGPGVSLIADVGKLTIGNVSDAGKGAGKDMVDFMRRWTPGGSNWYWAAAYEREVLDQLQQAVDPAASRSFRRKASAAQKLDTNYFYPPGASIVTGEGRVRAPDLTNAGGN